MFAPAERNNLVAELEDGRALNVCAVTVHPTISTSDHVAWSEGRRPLGAALHSPDEPSELSQ